MKKFYNKALMYQYYYTGRWVLFIGVMMFGMTAYYSITNTIDITRESISNLNGNSINGANFTVYLVSWFVLFAVYFAITGLNKKDSMGFLYSGPFTKEDIKKNQIISLLITLFIICLSYIYIFLCLSYRHTELIALIPNYYSVFIKDIIRLLVCGLAFISYLLLMDMMFSNIILEIIITIVSPFLFITVITLISSMYSYIVNREVTDVFIFYYLNNIINCIYSYVNGSYSRGVYSEYYVFNQFTVIFIILIFTLLFFAVSIYLNKIFKINKSNKMFNFEKVQSLCEGVLMFIPVIIAVNCLIRIFIVNRNVNLGYSTALLVFFSCFIITLGVTRYLRELFHKGIKKYL